MTQKNKIINLLADGEWHCTSEMYRMYLADPRTILAQMKKKGQVISRWCENPKHDHQMKEWKLLTNPNELYGMKIEARRDIGKDEWWLQPEYKKPVKVETNNNLALF